MNEQNGNMDINEIIEGAEEKFKQAVNTLNQFGTQARELMQKQPAVMLAAVALAGFFTGLLLRRSTSSR